LTRWQSAAARRRKHKRFTLILIRPNRVIPQTMRTPLRQIRDLREKGGPRNAHGGKLTFLVRETLNDPAC
jgi:hypothetical protein